MKTRPNTNQMQTNGRKQSTTKFKAINCTVERPLCAIDLSAHYLFNVVFVWKWSIIKWFAVGSWPDDGFSFWLWLCGQFYTLKAVYWTRRLRWTRRRCQRKLWFVFPKQRIFGWAFQLDGWCIVCPSKSIDHAEPAFSTIKSKLLVLLFAPRTHKSNSIQFNELVSIADCATLEFSLFIAHSHTKGEEKKIATQIPT